VMSYSSGPTYGSLDPITPQIYDVAAVQYLYGARTSDRPPPSGPFGMLV